MKNPKELHDEMIIVSNKLNNIKNNLITTIGKIIKSEQVFIDSDYGLNITYEYYSSTNDKYENTITIGIHWADNDQIANFKRDKNVGDHINIFYNSHNPNEHINTFKNDDFNLDKMIENVNNSIAQMESILKFEQIP